MVGGADCEHVMVCEAQYVGAALPPSTVCTLQKFVRLFIQQGGKQ